MTVDIAPGLVSAGKEAAARLTVLRTSAPTVFQSEVARLKAVAAPSTILTEWLNRIISQGQVTTKFASAVPVGQANALQTALNATVVPNKAATTTTTATTQTAVATNAAANAAAAAAAASSGSDSKMLWWFAGGLGLLMLMRKKKRRR